LGVREFVKYSVDYLAMLSKSCLALPCEAKRLNKVFLSDLILEYFEAVVLWKSFDEASDFFIIEAIIYSTSKERQPG
jgi:hypothetical protein